MSAFTLLNGVTSTGAGSAVTTSLYDKFVAHYSITGATTGATVQVRSESIDGVNSVLDERTLDSSTTGVVVEFDGPYPKIDANVSAYTDGTITVGLDAKTSR